MLTLACVVLFAAIAGAVQAADAVECRPSMNVGPADRTCVARRVCLLQSAPGELVLDDDASHVPAGLLDVPLAHVGSYATSPSLKLRFARSDTERQRTRAALHVAEPCFLVAASNSMFWHWIGDEFLALYWLLEHWLGQRTLASVDAALPVRVAVLERVSTHALQLVGTVTSRPLLLVTAAAEPPSTAADTVELARDVCFDRLYFGPASRQLGGPGSKYVDAALVARYAAFVARSHGLPAAPPAVSSGGGLLLFDYRTKERRITNLDEVRAAFAAQFHSVEQRFVDLAALTRREQLALLQRTGVYIAVHGSSFANLLWLPSGARVLEIFPFGFERPTYEGVCRKYLPHVRYHRWQNPDRSAAVFDRSILERHGATAAEIAAITTAPAYDYRMSWSANFYWINQDTRLPVAPHSTFMALTARLVRTEATDEL